MKWFYNLSITNKITLILGIITILLLIMFWFAFEEFQSIQINQRKVTEQNYQAVTELTQLTNDINNLRIQILSAMINPNLESNQQILKEVVTQIGDLKNSTVRLLQFLGNNEEHAKTIRELQTALEYYEKEELQGIELIEQGRITEAITLINSRGKDWLNYVHSLAEKIMIDVQKQVEELLLANSDKVATVIFWFFIFVSVFTVVTFYIGFKSYKIIGQPLNNLASKAKRVAEGHLDIELPETERKDEIGILTNSFIEMISSLKNLTHNITDSSITINDSAGQILNNITNLASSSSETATSISETTVTVEEARQATNLSNQKTKEVSERSQKSAEIAEVGRDSTHKTIEGINKIGQQMDSIAGNIIKLSEQSKAIGEIITSVNDLAEQSNLLAVNAAIEAARAGEHGKGFVVVAQEIRNLAEQSKKATAQVKHILDEIQNSINVSVLATEQGSKSVSAGIELAGQAGEAIEELAESINLAAEASMQIAASSQQQEVGINQIATAMENIKNASNHNADATKELDNSARQLQQVSESLKNMLEHFKV
ncbi:methyl-accepting chemotaxis protein [Bacteroidota bacterium]